jgi:hypothetical protein
MLLAVVQDFANGRPLSDDVSLSVIQRKANGTGETSSMKSWPSDSRVFQQRR